MGPRPNGLLLVAFLLLLSACSGDDVTDNKNSGGPGSITVSPGWVPEGLSLRGDARGRPRSELESRRSPIGVTVATGLMATQSAWRRLSLRIFGTDFDAGVEFDDPPFSIEDVLSEAMPGSVRSTSVRGMDAQVFSVPSGEEPSAWPAVVWMEESRLFWLLGEGLDESAVLRVANSIEAISLDRSCELAQNEQC